MNHPEQVEKIREKLKRNSYPSLSINRIPTKSYDAFIKLAESDFCKDYGMALKYLIDFHEGLIPSGIEHLEYAINDLTERLNRLEEKDKQPQTKSIKTIGGRTIRKGE